MRTLCLLLALVSCCNGAAAAPVPPVQLGQSFLRLDAPWEFDTSDESGPSLARDGPAHTRFEGGA